MNREERVRKAIELVMEAAVQKRITQERQEGIPGWDSWAVMSMPEIMASINDEDSDYFVRCVMESRNCNEEEAKRIIAANELAYVIRTEWETDEDTEYYCQIKVSPSGFTPEESEKAIKDLLFDFSAFSKASQQDTASQASDENWQLYKVYLDDWYEQGHEFEELPSSFSEFMLNEMDDDDCSYYYAKLLDEKQASGKEKIVYINGEEAVQYEGVEYTTDNDSIGYFAEGYPTDRQIELQDALDNATQDYIDALIDIVNEYGIKRDEQEHDMRILNEIREEAFDLLELPDIY